MRWKANPDRLRKAVDTLGLAVSEAERTHNSRKEVKRQSLAKAVGAENLTQQPHNQRDTTGLSLVGGVGVEPTWPCGPGILSPLRLPVPPPAPASHPSPLALATQGTASLLSGGF